MKEFKVFVSSTFYDMQVERDLLKSVVKRNLDAKYKRLGISIDFIDLRWGVNTKSEEEFEKDVIQVCLKEIQDCKPFFIAFLGERYGWVPDSQTKEKGCSFMTDEDYRLICQAQDISVTEMEIMYGAFRKNAELDNCIFCFRNAESYKNLKSNDKQIYFDTTENIKRIHKLKEKIRIQCSQKRAGRIIDYYLPTSSSYQSQLNELDSLANEILSTLSNRIDNIIKQEKAQDIPHDIKMVKEFIALHSDNYINRDNIERQIFDNIEWDQNSFNVIYGDSGFGKSYLLSHIFDVMSQKSGIIPVLYSTSFSQIKSTSEMVINSWIKQISFYTKHRMEEKSLEIDDRERLLQLVNKVKEQGKNIIFFLDAVENMEEDEMSKNLSFIPDGMDTIISVTDKKFSDYPHYHRNVHFFKIPYFSNEESGQLIGAIFKKAHFYLDKDTTDAIISKKTDDEHLASESPMWVFLVANLLVNLDFYDFFATKATAKHTTSFFSKIVGRFKGEASTIKTATDYIGSLVKTLPSSIEEMFLLMVKKAESYFGCGHVHQYLSLLCMSKYGLSPSDFELLFEGEWNITHFTKINQWFSSVIYDVKRGDGITFKHNILERSIRGQLTDEIDNARHHYIQVMRPILVNKNDATDAIESKAEGKIQRYYEYIYQLLVTGAFVDVAEICEETENEIIVGEVIREYLKSHENKLKGRYAPIWYRYNQYDFTNLERVLFKLININTERIDFLNYYWILAYHVGIQLMQKEDDDIALSLFYFLSEKIEKLSKKENADFLFENANNPRTYHNMRVLCYGNISSLCQQIHQYQEALHYLEKRHEAYLELNPLSLDRNNDVIANTGRYHYLYGTIMECWIGQKWNTVTHYIEAIKAFSYLDKKGGHFQHQSFYCDALLKVSSWYEKKNDIKKAIQYNTEALEKSEKYLDNGYAEFEDYQNAKEYFLSVKCLFDLCNRHHLDKNEYHTFLQDAWERIQYIYPKQYSDKTFRSLYLSIKEECVGGKEQENHLNDELELFEVLFSQAVEAFNNKHKNQAIELFSEAAKIVEMLYKQNSNSVFKRKLSQTYFNIGLLYQTKSDTTKFLPMSDEYLIKAGGMGCFDAYGVLSNNSKRRDDYVQAEEYLKIGASNGSSSCQRDYAICLFEKGEYESGRKYLDKAIADGDYMARLHQAIFMFNGEYGFDMNKQKAIYLLLSCVNNNNNEIAQNLLKRAQYYAKEYFECGLQYKLYHIDNFFDEPNKNNE